jgi:5'-nucleotidase
MTKDGMAKKWEKEKKKIALNPNAMHASRRDFLKKTLGLTGTLALGTWPLESLAETAAGAVRLTILHTNDVHSHLDPFPASDPRNAGKGGIVNRAKLISQIREAEKNVLLFDAGDAFQGTPYFNFFGGEPEIQAMSLLGYDAMTMGNHDFDGGAELFARQVKAHASFPVLVANYDVSQSPLSDTVKPYQVFRKEGVKIGVFGLGIAAEGLIPLNLFAGTRYLDPVQKANELASFLRNEEQCSLVVCLSHLGYRMDGNQISDLKLAPQTRGIDLIIGGHTHTFLKEPTTVLNLDGKPMLINQVGFGGINLGRLDFTFDRVTKQVFAQSRTTAVG